MTKHPALPPSPTPKMLERSNVGPGVFSNIVNVSATPREVFLDFGLMAPDTSLMGSGDATLVARIVLTREHAGELKEVLERTLRGKQ